MATRNPSAAGTWQELQAQQRRMVKPALAQLRRLIGSKSFWGTQLPLIGRLKAIQSEYKKALAAIPAKDRGAPEAEAAKVFNNVLHVTTPPADPILWTGTDNQRQRLKELSSWSLAMMQAAGIVRRSRLGEAMASSAAKILGEQAKNQTRDDPSIVDSIKDARKDLFNITGNLAAAGLAIAVLVLITRSK
jgi:hypothetical protein